MRGGVGDVVDCGVDVDGSVVCGCVSIIMIVNLFVIVIVIVVIILRTHFHRDGRTRRDNELGISGRVVEISDQWFGEIRWGSGRGRREIDDSSW